MSATINIGPNGDTPAQDACTRRTAEAAPPRRRGPRPVLRPWVRAQAINVTRHAAALRTFQRGEFGTAAAAPTAGHLDAVNQLIESLRCEMLKLSKHVTTAARAATSEPTAARLHTLLGYKERAHDSVRAIEKIWDFYFELFGQRQTRFADWLLSCDRIALDCYQYAYLNVGIAKSVPQPPPFCYMRTGFSPATFRRRIPLRALGLRLNPFPLIQLPYHRLVNPWTLGAILHEVSHNVQNDLDLAQVVPHRIAETLLRAGHGRFVATTWARWNRELFADVCGLLYGGPGVIPSLMDVIGRGADTVGAFDPRGPHPTPYLRAFISIELLRRMGFTEEAARYRRMWLVLYPNPRRGTIPRPMLDTFEAANRAVVDAVCYQPYRELGNKTLAQVLRFERKEQEMIEEAARRLAAGTDPGIVPERFLIGAARFAFDNQLARPEVIMNNFYAELSRR
jgi:hypothetical protein